MNKEAPKLFVLDAAQLVRIEAVHRGYLYQHLYAAQCLLSAAAMKAISVAVEGDEDVEIERTDRRIYIQVKHRLGALSWADIGSAIVRFEELRAAHKRGDRAGIGEFVIVSNSAPNGPLLERMNSKEWPSDVRIDWPAADGNNRTHPLPLPNLIEAIEATQSLAATLPFAMLAPETLVWKLSGIVMLAATGEQKALDHIFRVEALPDLFEQLVFQLQDLPVPPSPYRVQQNEPELFTGERVRIIAGYSGAGKTSWLAQSAQHTTGPLVYLDVADIPGPGLASTIGRELAARLYGRAGALGQVLLPGASGREILQGISRRIAEKGEQVTLALDNAHRVPSDDIVGVIQSSPSLKFILLCRPEGETPAFEAMLGIQREELSGWSPDTIASAAADANCRISVADCAALIDLTGGLPLYVQNALTIAKLDYDGDVKAFNADLAKATQTRETAQEQILGKIFERLPRAVADVADLLSLCDAAITREETAIYIAAAKGPDKPAVYRALRHLASHGLIQIFAGEKVKVHDAARIVGKARVGLNGEEFLRNSHIALRAIILDSLRQDWNPAKLSLALRLSGEVGEIEFLAEIGTDELFHEMGVWVEIEPFLKQAVSDESIPPDQRIKILDALAFAYLKEGNSEVDSILDQMDAIIATHALGAEESLRVGMKRMNYLAGKGDRKGAAKLIKALAGIAGKASDGHRRVYEYNVAVAELALGDAAAAIDRIEPLIKEYYDLIGLTPRQVVGKNAPQLRPLISEEAFDRGDLKHLADSLDVLAKAMNKEGNVSPFARIHALKFYDLAMAPESLFRVGQDLVDEFISRSDFEGALQAMEANLIPLLQQYRVAAYVVPVRSQYAVVLAYCGRFDDADREMARLRPYESGLDGRGRGELTNQRRLVEELREFGPPPGWSPPAGLLDKVMAQFQEGGSDFDPAAVPKIGKVGRNERCPCGSGKKFKKCHG